MKRQRGQKNDKNQKVVDNDNDDNFNVDENY